jgi:hypothetical protein
MSGCEVGCSVGQSAGRNGVLVVSKVGTMSDSAMVLVLVAQVVSSVCVLEVLREVHLWLVGLMSCVAVEQAMVLSVVAMVKHAVGIVGWRVGARGSVGRGCVYVRLEKAASIANWRAVAVGVEIPVVLVLVEILAAGMEPVKTICHHRAAKKTRERLSSAGVLGLLRVCEG